MMSSWLFTSLQQQCTKMVKVFKELKEIYLVLEKSSKIHPNERKSSIFLLYLDGKWKSLKSFEKKLRMNFENVYKYGKGFKLWSHMYKERLGNIRLYRRETEHLEKLASSNLLFKRYPWYFWNSKILILHDKKSM